MQIAIRDYDQGRDTDAMDGFMEVLSSGDPAERNMANEYINLITHRMFLGSTLNTKPAAPTPKPATVVEPLPQEGGAARRGAARPPLEVDTVPYYRPERMPSRTDAEPPRVSKAVMKKEIDAKLKALARSYLSEIEAYPEIRVLMADRQHPRALGIPADLLFDTGIVFKRGAKKVLDNIIGLVYCLGATQVAILPEGTAIGDTKILDMRRTMGISATLYSSGVAPPRVRVNLLNSQVQLPKGMVDFRGIIIVFVYNQPLTLTADSTLGDDGGPPVSLGVWPEKFRADRGEGSIIEFSVVEPPAGLTTWKFQLRQPGSGPGSDLLPLQEVVGAAPVFHQVYWNGRRHYFGPELPPGRYEVVLTSTDGRNRTRTLHRWIQLDGVAPAAAVAAAPAQPVTPPPAEIKPGKTAPVPFVQLTKKPKEPPIRSDGRKARKGAVKNRKAKGETKSADPLESEEAPLAAAEKEDKTEEFRQGKGGEPAAGEAPAPEEKTGAPAGAGAEAPAPEAPKPPAGSGSGAVTYKIPFAKGTQQMATEGDRAIGQVVEVLQYYPRENVNVVGYASESEPDAAALAKKRANTVSSLLVNRYSVDAKRIQQETRVVAEELHEVQIFTVTAKE